MRSYFQCVHKFINFWARESKCSQLQQFETLLALTNLLSCGNNEQDRFIADNGIQAVHYLIFSDNPMVRRAATEALCNLSGHESLLKVCINYRCLFPHC